MKAATQDQLTHDAHDAQGFDMRARVLRSAIGCLDGTSLADLTVAQVCDAAGISRPTFYRFFRDKYDIYNWYLRTTMRSSLAQVGIRFAWNDALIRFFRVMDANRAISQVYFASRHKNSPRYKFIEYMQRMLCANTLRHLNASAADGAACAKGANAASAAAGVYGAAGMKGASAAGAAIDELPYRYEFEIVAFSRAFSAALVDWLELDDPPYSMVDTVLSIVPHDLYKMLNTDLNGEAFSLRTLRLTDKTPLLEYVPEEDITVF